MLIRMNKWTTSFIGKSYLVWTGKLRLTTPNIKPIKPLKTPIFTPQFINFLFTFVCSCLKTFLIWRIIPFPLILYFFFCIIVTMVYHAKENAKKKPRPLFPQKQGVVYHEESCIITLTEPGVGTTYRKIFI